LIVYGDEKIKLERTKIGLIFGLFSCCCVLEKYDRHVESMSTCGNEKHPGPPQANPTLLVIDIITCATLPIARPRCEAQPVKPEGWRETNGSKGFTEA
jgi:hypothetical protein